MNKCCSESLRLELKDAAGVSSALYMHHAVWPMLLVHQQQALHVCCVHRSCVLLMTVIGRWQAAELGPDTELNEAYVHAQVYTGHNNEQYLQ